MEPSSPPAPQAPNLLPLVFAGGVASLGAEIAAARLLAPYFGASTIIWANTIAICLVALSLGYWYGGKLADRKPHERDLRRVTLLAAFLLAAIPFVAGPFLEGAVSAFDSLSAGAFIGSLLAVLLLLALPLTLLGTITPWALKLSITDLTRSGEIAGRLYAVSTVGSLTGVFLAALLLIPLVGTQRTFILFGAALALAAARPSVLGPRAVAVPALLAAALALPPGVTKPAEDRGEEVIEERETAYQYLRVIQDGDRRLLELNEGQAVHSIYDPKTPLTDGVWDGYSVLPFSVLDRPPRRMAMLGNAAGTVSRAYGRWYPQTEIDGVEIDGEVTDVGEEHFALTSSNPKLRTYDEDARPFLRRIDREYDLIGIDAYRQPYIPFYLATEEFFELTRKRLSPRGAVVVNVGHPEGQDALEETLTRTLSEVFPHVRRFAIEDTSTLLIASRVEPTAERLQDLPATRPAELELVRQDAQAGLAPPLQGGRVMTDDKAPVEWLIDSSIVSYAAGGGGD